MRFCQKHWEALKSAIAERGLDGLCAKSVDEIARKQFEELKSGAVKASTFDPLMGAHNAIVSRAIEIVGLGLLIPAEDGVEKCPLCHLQAGHDATCTEVGCTHSFEPWIGFAANDVRAEAVRLGLMATS